MSMSIPSYKVGDPRLPGAVEANMAGAVLNETLNVLSTSGSGRMEALNQLSTLTGLAAEADPALRTAGLTGIVDALKVTKQRHMAGELAHLATGSVGLDDFSGLMGEVDNKAVAGPNQVNVEPATVKAAKQVAKREMAQKRVTEWSSQNLDSNTFVISGTTNPARFKEWGGAQGSTDPELEGMFYDEKNKYIQQVVNEYDVKFKNGQIKALDIQNVINDVTKPQEIRDAMRAKFPDASPELGAEATGLYGALNANLDNMINADGTVNAASMNTVMGNFLGVTPEQSILLKKKIANEAFDRKELLESQKETIEEAKQGKIDAEWKLGWQKLLQGLKVAKGYAIAAIIPAIVLGGIASGGVLALGGLGIGSLITGGVAGAAFGTIGAGMGLTIEATVLSKFNGLHNESKALKDARAAVKTTTRTIRNLQFDMSLSSETKKDTALKYAAGFLSVKLGIDGEQARKVISDNNGVGNLRKLMQAVGS